MAGVQLSPQGVRALYLAHLPIKRRAFREGFLAGVEHIDADADADAEAGDWRSRPQLAARALEKVR